MSIQHINTYGDYLEAISSTQCIVKFTAKWCGPCQKIAPRFKELSEEHGNIIKFVEVDITKDSLSLKEIIKHEAVKGIPLFLFL